METHKDLTADEIRQFVRNLPEKAHLQLYSCVVFVLLSHGSKGVVYGVDWKKVKIRDELIYAINDMTCPQLKDIPKLWITQTCQGQDRNPTSNIKHTPSIKFPKSEEQTRILAE